jgi:hypothetical protein
MNICKRQLKTDTMLVPSYAIAKLGTVEKGTYLISFSGQTKRKGIFVKK